VPHSRPGPIARHPLSMRTTGKVRHNRGVTLADTQAIAVFAGRKPATIRSWAHRGLLTRRGTDQRGRALYDLDEAADLVARLDTPDRGMQHLGNRRTTVPKNRSVTHSHVLESRPELVQFGPFACPAVGQKQPLAWVSRAEFSQVTASSMSDPAVSQPPGLG
jgi:hypothetical protein